MFPDIKPANFKVTKRHIDILYQAKEFVERDSSPYICVALSAAGYMTNKAKANNLVSFVRSQLGKYYTYEDWLEANGGPPAVDRLPKEHRLAWLNKIIAYFEAKLGESK